jgi:hypothetical protein
MSLDSTGTGTGNGKGRLIAVARPLILSERIVHVRNSSTSNQNQNANENGTDNVIEYKVIMSTGQAVITPEIQRKLSDEEFIDLIKGTDADTDTSKKKILVELTIAGNSYSSKEHSNWFAYISRRIGAASNSTVHSIHFECDINSFLSTDF